MLEKAAFLDYKSFTENDELRYKQRKRILLCFGFDFSCFVSPHEICQVIVLFKSKFGQ